MSCYSCSCKTISHSDTSIFLSSLSSMKLKIVFVIHFGYFKFELISVWMAILLLMSFVTMPYTYYLC